LQIDPFGLAFNRSDRDAFGEHIRDPLTSDVFVLDLIIELGGRRRQHDVLLRADHLQHMDLGLL
jgi:hypothetical protein